MVRPLRTADDHGAALAEIESLTAAEADTPEGDRLEVLISLVEAWEARMCRSKPLIRSPQSCL
jgi:HTH-type transcriptional regulator/antitoxin HigA